MLQHSKRHGDGPCDYPGSAGACVVVLGVSLLNDVGHASHSMQGLHLLLNLGRGKAQQRDGETLEAGHIIRHCVKQRGKPLLDNARSGCSNVGHEAQAHTLNCKLLMTGFMTWH